MRAIAGLLLLIAFPAYSQTLPACGPASTVTPQPYNEARLSWVAPTTFTNGQTMPAGTVLTYTVYRRTGTTTTTFTAICTTTAVATALASQPIGLNTYTVTAKTPTSAESSQAIPHANKTVTDPNPTPNPPANLTIASTRIDPDSWTCRDEFGAILSRHERQDKAQESCTNFALANLGRAFEMRPSGYRIVAR